MLPFKTYQTNFLLLLTGFDMSWFICARKARFHAHVYVWIKVLQFFVLLKHTIDVPQIPRDLTYMATSVNRMLFKFV